MSSFDNFVHNYLDWSDNMIRDINEDPMYWLGASFILGVFFASFSWGIIFYLIFLVLYSFLYYYYCHYNGINGWFLDEQIGLFAASFFGFLIGRTIIKDDEHEESMTEFKYRTKYWLEELDICESTDEVKTFWEKKEKRKRKEREEKTYKRLKNKKGSNCCNYCNSILHNKRGGNKTSVHGNFNAKNKNDNNSYSYSSNDSSLSSGVSSDSIDRLTIIGYNRFI